MKRECDFPPKNVWCRREIYDKNQNMEGNRVKTLLFLFPLKFIFFVNWGVSLKDWREKGIGVVS